MFPGTRIENCAAENTCNVNIGKISLPRQSAKAISSEVVNPYDGLRRQMFLSAILQLQTQRMQ